MTNEQLAAARRVQNRYPEVAFRAVPGGVEVNGTFVAIGANMSPDEIRKALTVEVMRG